MTRRFYKRVPTRVVREFCAVFGQLLISQLQVLSQQRYEEMQLTQFALAGLVLFALIRQGGSVIPLVSTPSPEDLSFVEDLHCMLHANHSILTNRKTVVFHLLSADEQYTTFAFPQNITAYILSTCYGDRIRGIGLAGNLPDTLERTLSTRYLIPVVLIDGTPRYTTVTLAKPVQFRQALQIFVVEASTINELTSVIEANMRGTIWWNHMASFFILDRSPKCNYAIDFLHVCWTLNVLNAKVICNRLFSGKRFIFNFNPYTNEAPYPWGGLDIFTAKNNHPFAVFVRELKKNETTCVNLDFEKTKNLGGYEISVEGFVVGESNRSGINRNTNRYRRSRDRVFHNIFSSLNGKPKFIPFENFEDPMAADMRQTGYLMYHVWVITKITYPHKHIGLILISQFRGHKTQLEKILCIIDVYSRYGTGVVYFVTLIFLKFIVGQALISALLNLVRITCNTGFTNLTDTNASRIFLTCLLFFVVTMQGIYQSNLAALLTTNIPRKNVNVIQDVVDLDYKLYGSEYMKDIVKQYPELDGRFIQIDLDCHICIEHVMNDSSAACVWVAEGRVLDYVEEFELHTSSEAVVTMYSALNIRWDWPPEQRVNIILSRLVEADVILPWDIQCKPLQLTDYKYDKEVKNNKDFKKIELHELTFAFVILAIGLTCATVVFIVEVAIAPMYIKNREWIACRVH